MKRLYSSPDTAQAEVLHSFLEASGIPCEMRSDQFSQVIMGNSFVAELWVEDEYYDEAVRLLKDTPNAQPVIEE